MKVNKRKSHIISTLPAGFLGMSKAVMLGFVLVCLIVAGVIVFKSGSGGGSRGTDVYEGKKMWVMCGNPACEASYEMDSKEYYDFQQEHALESVRMMGAVPSPCNECGESSISQAVKCLGCGNVFIKGILGKSERADKCPECGYSDLEEKLKAARQGS